MILDPLKVFHWPRAQTAGGTGDSPVSIPGGAPGEDRFRLRTCQRDLEVRLDDCEDDSVDSTAEIYRATDAYRFLLEVATGLRSAIPGETNVFGQFRSAWRDLQASAPAAALQDLGAILERLFRDTRAIRTRFLQGIGGSSYGTLARRLLAPAAGERVLVVGSGALGRSVLPIFSEFELGLSYRSEPSIWPAHLDRRFGPGEEGAAVAWADHIVLCVPRSPELDHVWTALLADRPRTRVIHLGCRREERGPWMRLTRLFDLDDLFGLERQQAELRTRQLERARAACRHRAEELAAEVAPLELRPRSALSSEA